MTRWGLGLTFKGETDDTRDSLSIVLLNKLKKLNLKNCRTIFWSHHPHDSISKFNNVKISKTALLGNTSSITKNGKFRSKINKKRKIIVTTQPENKKMTGPKTTIRIMHYEDHNRKLLKKYSHKI